ncbi:hypothetical protein [uncultured Algimonas sp.]|uniref:hypothetical protein n=1 Tax=uncultured Algimonas sp. TaxID=1547920 RepID=UPI0026053CC0|nr:hypothetical protein [uncultured Algimonas sp.]
MSDTTTPTPDVGDIIGQLQGKLIALGRAVDTLPAKEIEATAKSINLLITSLEKADGYLRRHAPPAPGGGLSAPSRLDLLRRIKRMVENGVLRELDEPGRTDA